MTRILPLLLLMLSIQPMLGATLELESIYYFPINAIGDNEHPKATYQPIRLSYNHPDNLLTIEFTHTKRVYTLSPDVSYSSRMTYSRYIILQETQNRNQVTIYNNPSGQCDITLSIPISKTYPQEYRSYYYRYRNCSIRGFDELYTELPLRESDMQELVE